MSIQLDALKYRDITAQEPPLDLVPYRVSLPYTPNFQQARQKVMVVLEAIEHYDLKAGRLLSHPKQRKALTRIFYEAFSYVKRAEKQGWAQVTDDYGYLFVNYTAVKTFDLPTETQRESAYEYMASRVWEIAKKVKPDIIVILGLNATRDLFKVHPKQATRYMGRFLPAPEHAGIKAHCIPVYWHRPSPLSFFHENNNTFQKFVNEDEALNAANTVNFTIRNLSTLYAQEQLFTLKDLKVNPVYVDTMEKFNQMMARLEQQIQEGKPIALDTETESLDALDNDILTIQFAVSSREGYVVPLHHRSSPFIFPDYKEIKQRLRDFFAGSPKNSYLVGQNLKFDCRGIRLNFNIPHLHWPLWDTMAGEHNLDENLSCVSYSIFGLGEMTSHYGNDFYHTATFSKHNRYTIANIDLDQPVLEYASADVQFVYAIHVMQRRRARITLHQMNNKLVDYSLWQKKLMLFLYSPIIHTMSMMEQRGVLLNARYLLSCMGKNSEIAKLIREAEENLYASPAVKKLNSILLREHGVPKKTLFGGSGSDTQIFNLSTQEHKRRLFFDILSLEPINRGKTGEPSLDKEFQAQYKNVYEVECLTKINKLKKIESAYIKAFWKHLTESRDGQKDQRLRPSYGYHTIVTGRSNSFKPSLQQIPQHSEVAKIIKKAFIAPQGKVIIKGDYMAHEVRGWGLISHDPAIASAFQAGKTLREEYRKNPTPKKKEELDLKGDIHKVNYNLFTGVPIDKITKEQRQESKGITFGAIYGKAVRTLAKDLDKPMEYMEQVVSRFFSKFQNASKWLDWTKKFAKTNLYTYSPLGRRRNLPGYIFDIESVNAALSRRAANSPIQGMSSDFGYIAARLFSTYIYEYLEYMGETMNVPVLPIGVNTMVHDSIETETPYEHILVVLHLKEYATTIGVEKYVKEVFNFDFVVGLEFEFSFFIQADRVHDWDFTEANLREVMTKLEEESGDKILPLTLTEKQKKFLEKYPLGVSTTK